MSLLVGTRKGLFTLERNGDDWSIVDVDFLGEHLSTAMRLPDGTLFAALDTGHFGAHLWRKRPGAAWEEVGVPVYPERPADATDLHGFTQQPWDWSLKFMWTLDVAPGPSGDRLWTGTSPGGLFYSDDHGDTWTLNRPLWDRPERGNWIAGGFDWPGIHSVLVHPTEPDTVLVGVSSGGALLTTDAGATWTIGHGMRNEYTPEGEEYEPNGQDPHRLARCNGTPNVVWNQHHNGCFKSVDGGLTWTEIVDRAPSVFGFACAAHPTDGDVAWFAPAVKDESRVAVDASVVVSRTSDGGKTFDVFGDGLPSGHAYDLVYRHALDVDSSGNRLAMGSTTGSLWTSASAGEYWSTVSTNLPPIYFVRFV
jgi:hypothetical protein